MSWSEALICRALQRQLFNRRCIVLVDRCTWTGDEADVLGVTMDGRLRGYRVCFLCGGNVKKWNRLVTLGELVGVQLSEHDPVASFLTLRDKFPRPVISIKSNSLAVVDGVAVPIKQLAERALYSLESRGGITDETWRLSVESVCKRIALRAASVSASRQQKMTGMRWESVLVVNHANAAVFYASPEWRQIRYRALEIHGNNCMACGRCPRDGIVVHVDHIKPRSTNPELALDLENLQILCEDCNLGKSNKSAKDWRVERQGEAGHAD
jgi:hypothetical protein